ncbi:ABC transporter ATP-binding protein [Sulfoacidibacillus ferrooxidans]|uniref:Vitamin B12 import ATP-binding protein BtuD n=1 Tax=Sulfoacidibacillus ferrooxidans TaxID=2005001 RepID=A0A9X2AG37_9BACL|nr:ABC transporter ATP-binding protein [Sulfoacidibacillus ferrooxidans]MCI0184736.1 Vitamin B12 import ATP-binding protein BtuD [Sulfoacidibacillus ferrooxidans]
MNTKQLLYALVKFSPWKYLLYAFFAIAGWVLLILPAYFGNRFFDSLSNHAAANTVWGIIALFLMGNVARIMTNFGNFDTDVVFRNSIGLLMRKNMLQNILRKPAAKALPFSAGEAISNFREDVEEVTVFLGWAAFLDVVGALVFASIAIVIMMQMQWMITLVVFIPLTVVTFLAQKAGKRIDKLRQYSRKSTANLTGFIGELFGAVQAVQANTSERSVMNRFQMVNQERQDAMIKESVFSAVLSSVFTNIVDVGTGIILLLVAASMRDGSFTVGQFAAFIYYLTFIAQLSRRSGLLSAKLKQVTVSFDRINKLLQGAPKEEIVKHGPIYLKESLPEVPYVEKTQSHHLNSLLATGLSFSYEDTGRGIENVNLELKRGALTVVVGRIGSGKTTLLRALIGLLPVTKGEVYWNGEKVKDAATFFTPPRSAYAPQVPRLFSDSLRQNILMGLPESNVDLESAIHLAVLEKDIAQFSEGLDVKIGLRGVNLSGGQRQRTAAARMFVREPELFVMDDLSSALDVETESLMWNRLFTKSDDATYLVVSHRRAVLERADQIIVLREGRVVGNGRLSDLLESCEEMRQLLLEEMLA